VVTPELEEELFCSLAELLPPGGHLMCEYESPGRAETLTALAQGVPPILTPLGFTLFRAGCGAGFKDWYMAEGWTEGPRKLQGFKSLGPAWWADKARALAQELLDFLSSKGGRRYLEAYPDAAARARSVLQSLPLEGGDLRDQAAQALSALTST
jgi:hypothetical protein